MDFQPLSNDKFEFKSLFLDYTDLCAPVCYIGTFQEFFPRFSSAPLEN